MAESSGGEGKRKRKVGAEERQDDKAETIMYAGLKLLGWQESRLRRRKTEETNLDQYRGMYGVDPCVTAELIHDLETTEIVEALVETVDIDKLHWAMHWLYRYPTEIESESMWNKCANTIRDAHWFYVARIRALKALKIVWPTEEYQTLYADDIWVMTVDGTHLVTLEPGDGDIPKDPSYFSFKHHAAGFNYEIGICLFKSRCIWLSGPHKAGAYNDAKMFKECGLKDLLSAAGKMAIGDDGYCGFPKQVSTANGLDNEAVREFKVRSRQRHETYNSRLKQFAVLSEVFRCKNNPKDKLTAPEKLQIVLEAVVVLVQYKMELCSPLFDI